MVDTYTGQDNTGVSCERPERRVGRYQCYAGLQADEKVDDIVNWEWLRPAPLTDNHQTVPEIGGTHSGLCTQCPDIQYNTENVSRVYIVRGNKREIAIMVPRRIIGVNGMEHPNQRNLGAIQNRLL